MRLKGVRVRDIFLNGHERFNSYFDEEDAAGKGTTKGLECAMGIAFGEIRLERKGSAHGK
jgi:hypothetical protein